MQISKNQIQFNIVIYDPRFAMLATLSCLNGCKDKMFNLCFADLVMINCMFSPPAEVAGYQITTSKATPTLTLWRKSD